MKRGRKPNMLRRTRWYSRDLPTVEGVYEVEENSLHKPESESKFEWFSYWNGTMFMSRSFTADSAFTTKHMPSPSFGPMPLRWRGLYYSPARRAEDNNHAS